MKLSDYIVEFLIQKGITDIFGYPGGMVTHLMDSLSKYRDRIQVHLCCHEQAAAFEACGYAQALGRACAAYATSGPGATNLVTGICSAYFDSVPVIFITGQVNTYESKKGYHMRQRGFQETDIVRMVEGVTKYAAYVGDAGRIKFCLEQAYQAAVSGRRGPVLLDIPMDIQHADVRPGEMEGCLVPSGRAEDADYSIILDKIQAAKRPCILLGAAMEQVPREAVREFVGHMGMPVVTSMVAMDLLEHGHPLNYGFIGAYGHRKANFIVGKSDLVLAIGSRMDVRQVGGKREDFAPGAVIVRVDIDRGELGYPVRDNEAAVWADAADVIRYLEENCRIDKGRYAQWRQTCSEIVARLEGIDKREYNAYAERISGYVPENVAITADVGQNQVWVAQSFLVKSGQRVIFSGGHGAMGYSLPAAIGAYYATGRPVICFNGDGGIQMNIQELVYIQRGNLPIKIFVFNNYALGMIRHFQEMYFGGNYVQTVFGGGVPCP